MRSGETSGMNVTSLSYPSVQYSSDNDVQNARTATARYCCFTPDRGAKCCDERVSVYMSVRISPKPLARHAACVLLSATRLLPAFVYCYYQNYLIIIIIFV